jgi:hypothetical protein
MIDFKKYLSYLLNIQDQLPEAVYEFASDETRHDSSSPGSLHDAWLSKIAIVESRNGNTPFEPRVSLELTLLGPQHDRDMILTYSSVAEYEIAGKRNEFSYGDTFHGDIDQHEIKLADKKIQHTIWFHSASIIRIKFAEFSIEEQLLNA